MSGDNRPAGDLLLEAKIADAIAISEKKSIPKFTFFLDNRERSLAENKARSLKSKYDFYGGYENAERRLFAALPDWCDAADALYPVASITISYRKQDQLSHKDFLGTFMSFGIKRETVGDILVGEGKAVIFLHQDILPYCLTQIDKIGGIGVTVTEGIAGELPEAHAYKEITGTVSSARLDCVLCGLHNLSREDGKALILGGKVTLNYQICLSVSETVKENDIISVRGYGKYKISELSAKTKKGRIVLKALKYI